MFYREFSDIKVYSLGSAFVNQSFKKKKVKKIKIETFLLKRVYQRQQVQAGSRAQN